MTEAQLLDGQAFNRLVLEHDLAGKTWEQDGYIYTGFKGVAGYELYRTYGPKWRMLYQARRTVSQTNAGGGALAIRLQLATGFTAHLVSLRWEGPVTNTTHTIRILDEDAAAHLFIGNYAAAANATGNLPSIGDTSSTTGNRANSTGYILGPGQYLAVAGAAAANTETLTVAVTLMLPIEATTATVTWDTTGSAGTPVLAASTISAANTLQAVLLP